MTLVLYTFFSFQYQLLYHLFNMEAVKLGKRFILYSGMQHVEEQYRNVGLSKMQVQNFLDAFPKDGYFGMMVSCVFSNDRNIFGWADLRANLGPHNVYIYPPDFVGLDLVELDFLD